MDWILTDDRTGQHVRHKPQKVDVFHIIDSVCCGEDEYAVVYGAYVLYEEDPLDPDFVDAYLKPFGYASFAQIEDAYGDAAKQIVAECVFETKPFQFGRILYRGTQEECLAYIEKFVKEDK